MPTMRVLHILQIIYLYVNYLMNWHSLFLKNLIYKKEINQGPNCTLREKGKKTNMTTFVNTNNLTYY